MTGSSNTRSFDRLLGVLVTLTCGTTAYFMQKCSSRLIKALAKRLRRLKKNAESVSDLSGSFSGEDSTSTGWFGKSSNQSDELHKQRYSKTDTVMHTGFCHCHRVKFRMRAPSSLYAVDVPSKIRFPRVSVPCQNFEPLTDDSVLSFYPVKTDNVTTGIYTFCSFCGVHILYSPSIDPTELLINIECLEKSTVDKFSVAYYPCPESVPSLTSTFEAFKSLSKRGVGTSQQEGPVSQLHSTPSKPSSNNGFTATDFIKQRSRSTWNSTPSTAASTDHSDSGMKSVASSSSSGSTSNSTISRSTSSSEENFFNLWPLLSEQDQLPHSLPHHHQRVEHRREFPQKYQGKFRNVSPMKSTRRLSSRMPPSDASTLLNTPMQRQLRYHLKQHLLRDEVQNIVV